MLGIVLTIVSVLLAVSLAGCAVLWRQRGRLAGECEQLEGQKNSYADEVAHLRTEIELARQKHETAQQLLDKAEKQFRDTFDALAGKALKGSTEEFLKLAKQVFEAEQGKAAKNLESHKQSVESLVKPVRETLDKYNASLREIEKAREGAYRSLHDQLELLRRDQAMLRDETGNLVSALRKAEVRGRWGEVVLERILELSGLTESIHFDTQATLAGEQGLLRPDVIVRLPSERAIVIDSKTPMTAFMDSLECDSDEQRERCIDRHVDQIEAKIRDLASKAYGEAVSKEFGRTPDFTVLFIPGESFLYAAVGRRPDLLERAMERRIVIATPSTLIALLRVVAMGWGEQKMAENAMKIGRVARELYDRVETVIGYFEEHGKALRKAVESYGQIRRSFESRVTVTGRKLKKLGMKTNKQFTEELPTMDGLPALPEAEAAEDGGRSM